MTKNPWDVLPPPDRGDETPHTIFTQVGRALNAWEQVEEELAALFALMVGGDTPEPAMRAYGAIATHRARLDMLEEAFAAFNAATRINEDDYFLSLFKQCRGFSARRNEIAHGSVKILNFELKIDVSGMEFTAPEDKTWYLVSALYNSNKIPRDLGLAKLLKGVPLENVEQRLQEFVSHLSKHGISKFKYNADQVSYYADRFDELSTYARNIKNGLQYALQDVPKQEASL